MSSSTPSAGSSNHEDAWSVPAAGYFKCHRNPEALELILANSSAFILLYVIAYRAQRTTAFNRYSLAPGQALVGDYARYGMTERNYRTAKQLLQKAGFATFRATNKGTIATLTNSTVFDINVARSDGQTDKRPTDGRRTGDGRATTTKNGKNAPRISFKNGGQGSSPTSSSAEGSGKRLYPSDYERVIGAKRDLMSDLKRRHCSEVALGEHWDSEDARQKFNALRREVRGLTEQLANLAL